MKMRIAIIGMALVLALAPRMAAAGKVTYLANDHRFDFVRTKELKQKDAEALALRHPQQLDEQGLRSALASINLSRGHLFKKEVDTQRVFDDGAVDYLAINFARAFSQAKANEIVEFSYLSKQPLFILRNDRVSIGKAWLSDDGLHIRFDRLYVKITGDTDARGHEAEAINRATGLRMKLEINPGQQFSLGDPDEMILDLHHNFAEDLKKKESPPSPPEKTIAGETVGPAPEATSSKQEATKGSKKGKKEEAAEAAAASPTAGAAAPSTADQRLRAIEQLRKDGLISKKEYEQKKKEILEGL
jgi:hypothetical protein